jgi:hypothetical protein
MGIWRNGSCFVFSYRGEKPNQEKHWNNDNTQYQTPDSGFQDNKRSDCHFQGCHVSHAYYLSFDLYTEVTFYHTLSVRWKNPEYWRKRYLVFLSNISVLAARIRLTDTIKLSR